MDEDVKRTIDKFVAKERMLDSIKNTLEKDYEFIIDRVREGKEL